MFKNFTPPNHQAQSCTQYLGFIPQRRQSLPGGRGRAEGEMLSTTVRICSKISPSLCDECTFFFRQVSPVNWSPILRARDSGGVRELGAPQLRKQRGSSERSAGLTLSLAYTVHCTAPSVAGSAGFPYATSSYPPSSESKFAEESKHIKPIFGFPSEFSVLQRWKTRTNTV